MLVKCRSVIRIMPCAHFSPSYHSLLPILKYALTLRSLLLFSLNFKILEKIIGGSDRGEKHLGLPSGRIIEAKASLRTLCQVYPKLKLKKLLLESFFYHCIDCRG